MVFVVVVAAVTEHDVGAVSRSAALAPYVRHCLEQWNELGDVVAVAAGQDDGERDAGGIGDQVVLTARPAPVDRTSSRLGSPFNARTWEPSTAARAVGLRLLAFGHVPAADRAHAPRAELEWITDTGDELGISAPGRGLWQTLDRSEVDHAKRG